MIKHIFTNNIGDHRVNKNVSKIDKKNLTHHKQGKIGNVCCYNAQYQQHFLSEALLEDFELDLPPILMCP